MISDWLSDESLEPWVLLPDKHDVPLMDEKNSKLVLIRNLPQDQSTDSEVLELVKMLECLPIAITLATAFVSLKNPRMMIAKYLRYFRENEEILLENIGDLRRNPNMPFSVIKTWHVSFGQTKKDHP